MRRLLLVVLALVASMLPTGVRAAPAEARIVVSSTLDDELQVFGASSLAELQPPILSKGAGPVRLFVYEHGARRYLFAANHGVEGSLGIFDLNADMITELPASPFPARPGSVGVAAAGGFAYVTNSWHALGGCGLPKGSVTSFDLSLLDDFGVALEAGTVETSGAIPYGVATDGVRAYVSNNCSATLDTVTSSGITSSRATGAGPDGVIYDQATGLIFVNNINASSVSVFEPLGAAVTTIPLPATAHPIDSNLADTTAGHRWLLTSNGGDDSVGVIDRIAAASCASAGRATCPEAYLASIPTGVRGGAPEGVDYDPATNRIFTVNKTPYASPTLSVIQIDEDNLAASHKIADLPLGLGPVPAVTSFDVVVAR